MRTPDIFLPTRRAIGIAHRGSRILWPENTAVAFQGAADLGYTRFETDVRVTVDGVLVCYHDPVLSRTTNGHGFVARTTYDEIRRLDAGYRHRFDDRFPFRGQGVVVPTFAELAAMFPGVGWVVDLKADGTEAPLAKALEEFDLAERVIVGSFSNERVENFRRLTDGRVATSTPPRETLRAVMAAAAPRFNRPGEGVFHPTTCALQVPATWYGVPIVSSALVALAHAAGRLVHVWTVNGLDDVAALTELGVDGLITDRPDLVAP
ncbi:MAG TPA: glycerophosphodiester phosphodiesterase [Acidimicrobiia bacterium]|nr:glycerophosphodiester phosphodiesterase [Acidimicrobiia bacterium]